MMTLELLSPSRLEAAYDKASERQSRLCKELIAQGYGHERGRETRERATRHEIMAKRDSHQAKLKGIMAAIDRKIADDLCMFVTRGLAPFPRNANLSRIWSRYQLCNAPRVSLTVE